MSRYRLNNVEVWFGTSDAPAPSGIVAEATPEITVGMSLEAKDIVVILRYRRTGGPWQRMILRPSTTTMDAHYFKGKFPELPVGTRIEYEIYMRCGGVSPKPECRVGGTNSFEIKQGRDTGGVSSDILSSRVADSSKPKIKPKVWPTAGVTGMTTPKPSDSSPTRVQPKSTPPGKPDSAGRTPLSSDKPVQPKKAVLRPNIFRLTPKDREKLNEPEKELINRKLDSRFKERLIGRVVSASEPLKAAIHKLTIDHREFSGKTMDDVLKLHVFPELKKNEGLAKEVEAIENKLPGGASEKVDDALHLNTPLVNNPLLTDELRVTRTAEYARISKLDAGAADKLIQKSMSLEEASEWEWDNLVKEGILTNNQKDDLIFTVDLGRLTNDNFKLMERLKTVNRKSVRDFVSLSKSDWLKVIEDEKIEPPPGETREDYAGNIAYSIDKTFPSQVLLHQLTRIDVKKATDSLDEVTPLFAENDRLIHKGKVSVTNWDKIPPAHRGKVGETLNNLVNLANTYRYMGIAEVINDKNIALAQKKNVITSRIKHLNTFNKNNPDLDLRFVNFFDKKNGKLNWKDIPAADQPLVRKQLMAYQRTLNLADTVEDRQALLKNGNDSAIKIARMTAGEFANISGLDYGTAQGIYGRALTGAIVLSHGLQMFGEVAWETRTNVSNTSPQLINDLQEIDGFDDMFGPQDYCDCAHCKSILGPAAYFVDLMYFIEQHVSKPVFRALRISRREWMENVYPEGVRPFSIRDLTNHPLHLKKRRPDLWTLKLTCENTNTLVPYLTIVNEVLESYLEHNNIIQGGDIFRTLSKQTLAREKISFQLPFNLPLEEIRIYLKHFGIALYDVYRILKQPEDKIWRERLSLSAEEVDVITTADIRVILPDLTPSVRYRFGNPLSLDDFPVNDYKDEVTKVDRRGFIKFAGITRKQLGELLTISFNTDLQNITVDPMPLPDELQNFPEILKGLNDTRLDFIHRFIRLWKKTSWSIPELDMVLTALQKAHLVASLDGGPAVPYLAQLVDIQEKLKLTVEELCAMFHYLPVSKSFPMPPDKQADQRLYERLFVDLKKLFGEKDSRTHELHQSTTFYHYSLNNNPNDMRIDPKTPILLGGLGISETELLMLAKLLKDSMPFGGNGETTLNRENISLLYRHARLARALKLSVEDFIQSLYLNFASNDLVVTKLEQIHQLKAFRDWLKSSPFTVSELRFILKGEESNTVKYKTTLDTVVTIVQETQKYQVIDKTTREAIGKIVQESQKSQDRVKALKDSLSRYFNLTADQLSAVLKVVSFPINSSEIQTALGARFTNGIPDNPADLNALLNLVNEIERIVTIGGMVQEVQKNQTTDKTTLETIGKIVQRVQDPQITDKIAELKKALLQLFLLEANPVHLDEVLDVVPANINITSTGIQTALNATFTNGSPDNPADLDALFLLVSEIERIETIAGIVLEVQNPQETDKEKALKDSLSRLFGMTADQLIEVLNKVSTDITGTGIQTALNTPFTPNGVPVNPADLEPLSNLVQEIGWIERTELLKKALATFFQVTNDHLAEDLKLGTIGITSQEIRTAMSARFINGSPVHLANLNTLFDLVKEIERIERAEILKNALAKHFNLTADQLTDTLKWVGTDINDPGIQTALYPQFTVYPDFSADEFVLPLTIAGLCTVINNDQYNIPLQAPINTLAWLNELLRIPNFYDILLIKKPGKGFSAAIMNLVNETSNYRGQNYSDLDNDQQNTIKRLNRFLLEETYPEETPKSTFSNGVFVHPIVLEPLTKVLTVMHEMERILLVFSNLKFKEETIAYLTTNPATLDIAYFKNPNLNDFLTLNDLKALTFYKKLITLGEEAEAMVQTVMDHYLTRKDFSNDMTTLADLWQQDKSLIVSLTKTLTLDTVPIRALEYLWECLNLCQTLGINGFSLQDLAKATNYDELIRAREVALGAFSSKYEDEKVRREKLEPYQDRINVIKRDALCDYIIAREKDLKFKDMGDIYAFFLLDVEMSGCFRTSRVVCAISSLQLYIHRILVNLEQSASDGFSVLIAMKEFDEQKLNEFKQEWEWRKNYRVWEANRKVFLYPENYIEPDLRDNKSPIFKELEDELLQQKITKESAEAAYKKYLAQFAELARLRIAGSYYHADTNTYYFFGRTQQDPPQYYYRKWVDSKVWTSWEKIELGINSDMVAAIIHLGKLYLFWVDNKEKTQNSFQDGTSDESYIYEKYLNFSFINEQDKWHTCQRLLLYPDPYLLLGVQSKYKRSLNNIIYPVIHNKQIYVVLCDSFNSTDKNVYISQCDLFNNSLSKVSEINFPPRLILPNSKLLVIDIQRECTDDADSVETHTYSESNGIGTSRIGLIARQCVFPYYLSKFNNEKELYESEFHVLHLWKSSYDKKENLTKLTSEVGKDINLSIVSHRPGDHVLAISGQQYLIQQTENGFPIRITHRISTSLVDELGEILFSKGLETFLALDTQRKKEHPLEITITDKSELSEPYDHPHHIDFEGAYGGYYQELFFHIPFLIANHLNANQKFKEAKWWYERIFDPTSTEVPAHQRPTDRNWQYIEFRNKEIKKMQDILTDPAAIEMYKKDPFNPHAIARLRISAYQKTVVMKYIDNLLDWGDYLFAQDTMESINEATMLYILASNILGKRPVKLGPCKTAADVKLTYEEIGPAIGEEPVLGEKSEFLITLENWFRSTMFEAQTARYVIAVPSNATPSTMNTTPASSTGGTIGVSKAKASAETSFPFINISAKEAKLRYKVAPYTRVAEEKKQPTGSDKARGLTGNVKSRVPVTNLTAAATPDTSDAIVLSTTPVTTDVVSTVPAIAATLTGSTAVARDPGIQFVQESTMVFCVPHNEEFLKYWDRVEDRLFKIRNCMNISGVRRQLALFQPPINPMLLVRAKAAGLSLEDVLGMLAAQLPPYRFSHLIEKAKQFTQTVQSFGSTLLIALEKKDVEELTLLRSVHERNILRMTKEIKKQQHKEAQYQYQAMVETETNVQNRITYYEGLIEAGLTEWEVTQQVSRHTATIIKGTEELVRIGAAIAGYTPQVGSPFAITYGGIQIKGALAQTASAISSAANLAELISASAGLEATFQRREEEWKQQLLLAQQELKQVGQQKLVAEIRQSIAEKDLEIHEKNIEQADELHEFYKGKFTNLGLYNYLSTTLSRLYREAYNVAYDMAKMAERTYQFERDDDTIFIAGDNWQFDRAGLLAGERLLLQLQRMEKAYLERHTRDYEVTQSFSLALLNPGELLKLRQTGTCEFTIPEIAYDFFYPGQYKRIIKSVRITIPCVTGPYINISAKLTLAGSKVRKEVPADPASLQDPATLIDIPNQKLTSIATSNAQNDGGVFELNFRDERYLPFEGAGAISTWGLELPSKLRSFSYDTISDVIIHISYTAKDDGAFRVIVENQIADTLSAYASNPGLYRLLSLKHEFPSAFHKLLNPQAGAAQTTEFSVEKSHFPYLFIDKTLTISEPKIYLKPKKGLSISTTPSMKINAANVNVTWDPSEDIEVPGKTDPEIDKMKGGKVSISGNIPITLTIDAGTTALNKDELDDILILMKYTITTP